MQEVGLRCYYSFLKDKNPDFFGSLVLLFHKFLNQHKINQTSRFNFLTLISPD